MKLDRMPAFALAGALALPPNVASDTPAAEPSSSAARITDVRMGVGPRDQDVFGGGPLTPWDEIRAAFGRGFVIGAALGWICGIETGDWCGGGTPRDAVRVGLRVGTFAATGAVAYQAIRSGLSIRTRRDRRITVTVAPVRKGASGAVTFSWR